MATSGDATPFLGILLVSAVVCLCSALMHWCHLLWAVRPVAVGGGGGGGGGMGRGWGVGGLRINDNNIKLFNSVLTYK